MYFTQLEFLFRCQRHWLRYSTNACHWSYLNVGFLYDSFLSHIGRRFQLFPILHLHKFTYSYTVLKWDCHPVPPFFIMYLRIVILSLLFVILYLLSSSCTSWLSSFASCLSSCTSLLHHLPPICHPLPPDCHPVPPFFITYLLIVILYLLIVILYLLIVILYLPSSSLTS
jgi:hypothetical protein